MRVLHFKGAKVAVHFALPMFRTPRGHSGCSRRPDLQDQGPSYAPFRSILATNKALADDGHDQPRRTLPSEVDAEQKIEPKDWMPEKYRKT
jgi:hypothetical protein